MKKFKPYLRFSFFFVLLEMLAILALATRKDLVKSVYPLVNVSVVLVFLWFCGCVILVIKKGKLNRFFSKLLTLATTIAATILLLFSGLCLLVAGHDVPGNFSATTSLFEGKNVLVLAPHQDDEINILGGLIEQYVGSGSHISVVFTTNGDRYDTQEIRAAEAVEVLTTLGVQKENITYLGFGNEWTPQTVNDQEIAHIYNSPDPDAIWTSMYGATNTYSTNAIGCDFNLAYTRSNYLYTLQTVIERQMPDTIFVVDYDSHLDHRASDLLFEEALCHILTLYPDYHPTVYKGFSYGTAWMAVDDYFGSDNLLSTQKPDSETWAASAFGYAWEDRVRFPMSQSNLNWIMSNNSVYVSMNQYESQDAWWRVERVINGDKVFWERRTDSLLYKADIYVGDEPTTLLNNFKLKDFQTIAGTPGTNIDVATVNDKTVSVSWREVVTLNSIYLYDSTDPESNILDGFIFFSDGSRVDFGNLRPDGSATRLSFPEKQIDWMEIVVTQYSGETAGLCEIEAFYDVPTVDTTDSYLMALDGDDNFVYEYLLHDRDSVPLTIGRFPDGARLREADLTVDFVSSGKNVACHWENDTLIVTCPKGGNCTITVSDGIASTTFAISNPSALAYGYLQTLRAVEQVALNLDMLSEIVVYFLEYFVDAHFA